VKTVPMHRLVFFGLVVYAVTLALITGDTGFQADDWWILSVPYWNSFPQSIWQYTVEFRRPLEGLPWLMSYPLVGFNRIFFNLVAYFLLAATALLMGACLTRAFPRRRAFVAATMLFWFFSPTVCPLLYVFHMDNIWTCTLLFWGAVLAFQVWAEKGGHRRGLILPVLLYYLSTLAYDAANLLLLLVPLFVFRCRQRNRYGISEPAFWLRLCSGMAVGFLVPYLIAPFQSVPIDAWAIGAGCLIMVFAALLLFSDPWPGLQERNGSETAQGSDAILMLLWAVGLIVLGTFPYLMAGYGASLGFHGESRVYSAASFGLAILLGCASTIWGRRRALLVSKLVAVIALGFMAMFHVDLRRSWQEAEKINCKLWTSLTRQVPDVAPGTSFLFLDLQSYVSNRAIIFGGVNGLREFIRIFYHRRDIDAHYLYLWENGVASPKSRTATVSAKGIVARGVLPTEPIALNKLLIAERVGDRLVLLDKISAADKVAAIRWEGVTEIRSNRSLILPPRRTGVPFRGVCCSWCGW
jgi:hypothetical protein